MEYYKKQKVKSRIAWSIGVILAVCWLLIAVLPFIFMTLNSLKDKFEIIVNGVFSIPESWNFSNYAEVLQGGFWRYLFNSVFVLAISLVLLLFISSCAAYPLARFSFRLQALSLGLIVACMSIPVHITLIPIFKMATKTGLYDSIWALIGPYVAFGLPISVFMMVGFMKKIPKEIEESAAIDGCNKYQLFFKMILPLSKSGLVTMAIYNGVNMWNEFSFAYTLTQDQANRTLPLALWEYKGQYTMNTPMIMAVLTLTVFPMLIMFVIFKDKLMEGMTAGAIKG